MANQPYVIQWMAVFDTGSEIESLGWSGTREMCERVGRRQLERICADMLKKTRSATEKRRVMARTTRMQRSFEAVEYRLFPRAKGVLHV